MKRTADPKPFANIVSSIRIDHAQYKVIRTRLGEAFEDVGKTPTPTCLHVIGETRTGKSSVVKEFLDDSPQLRSAERDVRSVVYAIAPPNATVKSLLESLLKGLGDPYWSRGTESNMQGRLHTLLEAVSCRMIVIDEFQHLCDKGQGKRLVQTSDFLKNLIEGNRWGLIAVGLPTSTAVIHTNPQLFGRFDPSLTMPLFSWTDAGLRKQFRAILVAFQKQMAPFQLPDLAEAENALRLYMATTGRLGLLAKLMDRAVRQAVRRNSFDIGLPELQRAFDSAIWFADRFPLKGGPFGADLDLADADALVQLNTLATQEMYEDNSGKVTVTSSGGRPADAPPARRTKAAHARQMEKAL